MPLPALSLWPGRQPYRPRVVGGRRGGGPSSVAPRSRNPPMFYHYRLLRANGERATKCPGSNWLKRGKSNQVSGV